MSEFFSDSLTAKVLQKLHGFSLNVKIPEVVVLVNDAHTRLFVCIKPSKIH